VPERPYLYIINDYDVKQFDKKPEEFIKPPLKPIEAVPAPIPAKYQKGASKK
jgi:hypothetical protein